MSGNLGGVFDANAKENQKKSSAVPAGDYDAIMFKSDRRETKKRDGWYIYSEFKITRGEYQNRVIVHRFNLGSNSVAARDIGKGQFSELARAVDTPNVNDSSELHNKPCGIKVKVVDDPQYGLKNEITKFVAKQIRPAAPAQLSETVAAASGSADLWAVA